METDQPTPTATPLEADEPNVPGAPLRLGSILFWQTCAVLCGTLLLWLVSRGAPLSLVLGAALMTGSLLLSRQALLYTEMVTTGAIIHGKRMKLLGFSPEDGVPGRVCIRVGKQ